MQPTDEANSGGGGLMSLQGPSYTRIVIKGYLPRFIHIFNKQYKSMWEMLGQVVLQPVC